MRQFSIAAAVFSLLSAAQAGSWGGAVTFNSAYNDFHIYYDDRDESAGLQATFEDISLTGSYTAGTHSVSVRLSGADDPDFDNFWGGNGNWDSNGDPCTPATCPRSADRSEFTVTYTRSLRDGFSAYGGFYSGAITWKEVQGRATREAAGSNPTIANICEVNGNTVQTTTDFENENFGLFIGGAYSRRFTDKLFGTARLAVVLDGEADVSEEYTCAGGAAPQIGATGTLFEGTASSLGLSLFFAIDGKSGLNLAYDTKSFSYDDGVDYWSGGTARTEESLDILSFGYVFNF